MKRCLEGIKVLELSHYIAAPYCCQLLADMGAEIIKIERPNEGEVYRTYFPRINGESLYYVAYNRNKRSVSLDIQTEKGKELLRKLVAKSDVVVENMRPGMLARMGFGYEDLKKINSRIVMTSLSGFGQYGPYKDRQGIDMMIQAMGGLVNVTGFPDGPPVRPGPTIADHTTAIYGALGTMFALFHRERTGEGQFVDVALLDSVFSLLENYPILYLLQGTEVQRAGNGRSLTAPSGAYQAKDGYVYITAMADNLFQRMMKLSGHPEMAADIKYADPLSRKQNEQELHRVIGEWVEKRTIAEAMSELDAAGIPNGPVNSVGQITTDPQIKARDMVWEVEHPAIGKLPMIGNPIKLSLTPGDTRMAPPMLGQHNEEVFLNFLNLSKEELEQLKQEKII